VNQDDVKKTYYEGGRKASRWQRLERDRKELRFEGDEGKKHQKTKGGRVNKRGGRTHAGFKEVRRKTEITHTRRSEADDPINRKRGEKGHIWPGSKKERNSDRDD